MSGYVGQCNPDLLGKGKVRLMVETNVKYDVVVVGGGAAGVAAAVGAAQAGARTLLLESAGFLGGAATLKCVQTYCGLYTITDQARPAVAGVAAQVIATLRRLGGVEGPVKFRGVFMLLDTEAVKYALDTVGEDAGVDVLLHAQMVRAERDGDAVSSVTYHDHNGDHTVTADAFVDATGECDLAFFAGASTRYGNHGFVNLGTLGTRFGGIAPEADLSEETWHNAIHAAKQAGVGPLSKDTSMLARVPLSGDVITYLVSEAYDARSAASISTAERLGRKQAWAYLDVIRTIKGCQNAYLAVTGPSFGTRKAGTSTPATSSPKPTSPRVRASMTPSPSAPGAWSGTTPRRPKANSNCPAATASTRYRSARSPVSTPPTCSPPGAPPTATNTPALRYASWAPRSPPAKPAASQPPNTPTTSRQPSPRSSQRYAPKARS